MRFIIILAFILFGTTLYAQVGPEYNVLVSPTIIADDVTASTFNGVKVYRAILNQTGTSAPAPIVLSNSLGEITWARSDTGTYTATSDSLFTVGKTLCSNGLVNITTGSAFGVTHTNVTTLTFTTKAAILDAARADDVFENTVIEIRVYP